MEEEGETGNAGWGRCEDEIVSESARLSQLERSVKRNNGKGKGKGKGEVETEVYENAAETVGRRWD